jgi:alkanesulfonate monooxygenase SsuD/methylene tetrahydromethanopterin reductase-like flavin-dependent oxidoreductase (luciferase family)
MEFGFAPVQSHTNFDAMRAQATLAGALAALAPVTSTIGLGTNMLLLPIDHPVRMAQEAAMLDALSNGRLRLGVANGYSERYMPAFGMLVEQIIPMV